MELEESLRQKVVNTVKMLAVDGVEKANSGHPGMPMGCADIAVELWCRTMRYNPNEPHWPDRDRFVLSAGHGSMLLYSMLHLSGYDLPMSELQRFRQIDSKTPGHPESFMTPGVECTTGPLGQGIANAIGMAIAGKMMKARFPSLYAHQRIFGICSDGDLMEGVSHEASSLAGHLGLDNLIFFYDDNHISIDGETELALSDDACKRFEAYGWFVQHIDGHDPKAIRAALDNASTKNGGKPSMIVARTHIANGSPNKHDKESAHGNPLGKDEVAATKKALGWPESPTFLVPDDVKKVFADRAAENKKSFDEWTKARDALSADDRKRWESFTSKEIPPQLVDELFAAARGISDKPDATRSLAGKVEQVAAKLCPWLVGGSADLNPSTNTFIKDSPDVQKTRWEGRNIHFGVREHGMLSINNGIALSGLAPFGSTFLIFSDYCRPAIRLAALSHIQSIFVFTHDSIFLGEDGPTHQPIEQVAALRLIPNLRVVRPADAYECAAAWAYALQRQHAPTLLVLTRQKLPPLDHAARDPKEALQGAYRLIDPPGANAVFLATGSEVHVAVAAAKALANEGVQARVVSAPCLEALEDSGNQAYSKVLPDDGLPRVSIEAGRTIWWKHIVGKGGLTIGIDTFGASAPEKDLQKKFGLGTEQVTETVRSWWKSRK